MRKSIVFLGVALGLGLAAVSCQNPNEVSYETAAPAAAGSGVKARPGASPSVFGSDNNPGR